jgi:phosphomannomutase
VWQTYVETTARLVSQPSANNSECKIVYTPMHGVGLPTALAVFEAAGMPRPEIVTEQAEPDPTFPTVAFPNPEEAGAMDLSFALARKVDADLVLANDPDADRLAVGIPDATAPDRFRRLTGDEVGLILGDWAAEGATKDARTGSLACSIVSSSALAKVAAAYGLDFKATLTGFKWISKVPELIFGYEEALGYCLDPEHTPDKDGISAAIVVASIANNLAAKASNLAEHLANLQRKHGFFATGQISIRVGNLSEIGRMMTALRRAPPETIDGVSATLTDLALGSADLPPTDGLLFNLADRRRVIVRPSGTEPKLKCYLQAEAESQDVAQAALRKLDAAMRALLV